MAVPKYNEFYNIILEALKDGKVHTLKEVMNHAVSELGLTDEELSEMLPSGKQTVFRNRIGWAGTYLKKADMIRSPSKAHFEITPNGQKLLASVDIITDDLLAKSSVPFADFKYKRRIKPDDSDVPTVPEPSPEKDETPQETFDRVYAMMNEELADDLLNEIMSHSPTFFERLVVDLMQAMDYGVGFVTKQSGDDGIDGVIYEDKLGFDMIYIQAKRWKPDSTVGKPEIQKFAGAMLEKSKVSKGLFITTATFSQGAQVYADAQHIILVDGQKLAKLMIEYGVGTAVQKTYAIKRIDGDYFSEE